MKKTFLVAYDYGMGGVWALVSARSDSEIIQKHPFLKVAENRPSWMTDQEYARVEFQGTFDIDQQPSGWLLLALKENS
jgi:hypothetical protein